MRCRAFPRMLIGFGVLGVAFFMARANRSADRWRSERMMMTPVALLSGLQGGFVEGKLGIGARQLYIKEKRGAARRA